VDWGKLLPEELPLAVLLGVASGQEYWWERGADRWYYKDDWKGLKITGASPLQPEIHLPQWAISYDFFNEPTYSTTGYECFAR
jgi:hypothetical protein